MANTLLMYSFLWYLRYTYTEPNWNSNLESSASWRVDPSNNDFEQQP